MGKYYTYNDMVAAYVNGAAIGEWTARAAARSTARRWLNSTVDLEGPVDIPVPSPETLEKIKQLDGRLKQLEKYAYKGDRYEPDWAANIQVGDSITFEKGDKTHRCYTVTKILKMDNIIRVVAGFHGETPRHFGFDYASPVWINRRPLVPPPDFSK